jgi:hypothetical protein
MARGLLDCPVKPGNDKEELGRAQTKSGRANPATSVMIETASLVADLLECDPFGRIGSHSELLGFEP